MNGNSNKRGKEEEGVRSWNRIEGNPKKIEKGRKMWMHVDYVRATKGVIK